jgi:hypothetical protein
MKKIILFLSLILSWIYLANFISAITINKNSWEVLDNTTWENISSLTNKIDVSWADIKLNWKLYVTWKICDNSWFCLGDSIEWTITNPWKSCLDLKGKWVDVDKEYYIKPDWYTGNAFKVYCDMTTNWWGRTRYVNIIWNYSATDASSCVTTQTIVKNSNIECFNPNQFNMAANNIMLKIWWQSYEKVLNWQVEKNVDTTRSHRKCTWHSEYMIKMIYTVEPTNDTYYYYWFWLNYCKYDAQVGWRSWTGSYRNYSNIWFWPNGSVREPSPEPTELFIK